MQRIGDLEAECTTLKGDIRERDNKIFDRDQRISSLKAESQQLAKFKFVLEYKLDSVKSQLEPKEAEIAALQKKIEVSNFARLVPIQQWQDKHLNAKFLQLRARIQYTLLPIFFLGQVALQAELESGRREGRGRRTCI